MPGPSTLIFGKNTLTIKFSGKLVTAIQIIDLNGSNLKTPEPVKFDIYLSEMSVSDLHGGGLTLQRIIGDGLMDIEHFVYVTRFGKDLPAGSKYLNRSICLTSFWEKDWVRLLIGNSLASLIGKKKLLIKLHAKNTARALHKKLPLKDVRVLVCPQSSVSLYTLEKIKRFRNVKYVTWIMDDHLLKFTDGKWVYENDIENLFGEHLKNAEHVFVISPAMQQFYFNRFGIRSTVLFGPCGFLNNKLTAFTLKQTPGLQIGYFGAVAAWQLDALVIVARVLASTNSQLHIYSGVEALPAQLCLNGVYFKGRLNPGEVLSTMKNYDAVLLPISFLEKMRNMSQFNIATKMSEYLAAGVPILAVGPPYAAMIKYLKINNAAIVVESGEEADIKNGFNMLRNQEKVSEILRNAEFLVNNETGVVPMQKRWLEIVNS